MRGSSNGHVSTRQLYFSTIGFSFDVRPDHQPHFEPVPELAWPRGWRPFIRRRVIKAYRDSGDCSKRLHGLMRHNSRFSLQNTRQVRGERKFASFLQQVQ